MKQELIVKNLRVAIDGKSILKGINLTVRSGELHVIMGPNGSGKSTLTYGLMGSPSYEVTADTLMLNKLNLLELAPEDRAKAGLQLAFQNPISVPGVTISNLLRTAYKEINKSENITPLAFHKFLKEKAQVLGLDDDFLRRSINDGFSGGEKKKVEMLQLLTLKPKFAMLDEIDTGLDVDALKIVSQGINALQKEMSGIILITHYQRILNYLSPQFVHILKQGQIIREGGPELVKYVEEKGYAEI